MKNTRSTLLSILLLFMAVCGSAQKTDENGTVALTLDEHDLLPESVAYDPKEEAFYIGSTRKGKIVKVDRNGNESTFIDMAAFGQWMIIGMKIDEKRNHLWFCSSGGGNLIGYSLDDEVDGRPAGVFKVDLATGSLIKKYMLENKGEVHFFNDLVIDSQGSVFVSHMFQEQAIYRIDPDKDEMLPYLKRDFIKYPNGLDVSDDGRYLFVAHSGGIARITIGTEEVISLAVAEDFKIESPASVDGLYFYQNSLIGVQPGIKRVARFSLSQNLQTITEVTVLDQNHPLMDHPTTGVVIGDEFHYIANAQFEKVKSDGTLAEEPGAPTIIKVKLK
ncbi:MAG: SMP-30/gluconolactonase/LRE family protein [Marinoscillum sp.]